MMKKLILAILIIIGIVLGVIVQNESFLGRTKFLATYLSFLYNILK